MQVQRAKQKGSCRQDLFWYQGGGTQASWIQVLLQSPASLLDPSCYLLDLYWIPPGSLW